MTIAMALPRRRVALLCLLITTAVHSCFAASTPPCVWLVALHPQLSASQLSPWDRMSTSRAERRVDVAAQFEALSRDAQRHVSAVILETAGTTSALEIVPLWIQNTLLVRLHDAGLSDQLDAFLTGTLRGVPGVVAVERDTPSGLQLLPVVATTNASSEAGGSPQKNVRLVHAPELWRQAKLRGQGVTVASIDSGVRYTHEALAETFRGHGGNVSFDYAFWFPTGTDVSKETPDTADRVGHGTHTVGTAVGALGIGVAPAATWIAARAFDLEGAVSTSDFLVATQWVLCPTKVDGTTKNCSLGADVITGSFGVDRTDVETYKQWTWLTHILQVWRAAGSFAVFASGNTNGFHCGSVYYPASRHETVAVGALLGGSSLWGASGKGPSVEDDGTTVVKPDFVAPGGAIRSALSMGDAAYTRMTGTSMATPHITGLLALLLSAGDTANQPDLVAALQRTASHALSKPFLVPSTCGGTRYDQFPNNIYGYGLPDVCKAAASTLGVTCTSSTSHGEGDGSQGLADWNDIVSVD